METLNKLREYIDSTPIEQLQKEWDSLTSHKYDLELTEGSELENWIGWLQVRIPELKKQHNAFWLKQALQGYADEFKNLNLGDVRLCDTCEIREGHFTKLFNGHYCDGCYDRKLNEA